MARTVVAIYDDFQSANSAVRELVDTGFPRDNISIIANSGHGEFSQDSSAPEAVTTGENVADETGAGAGVGAGIGAAIGGVGGLLVGLGALTIPGIGPVIAAGPLSVALSTLTGAGVGAVAGGVTGGLLGALIGLGIPEEEAEYYAEGIRRGGVLLTVQVDDFNTTQVIDVLNRHDPVDINERASQWRDEGWEGFDPAAGSIEDQQRQLEDEQGMRQAITYPVDFNVESDSYRSHYDTSLANAGYPYEYYVPAYRYGHELASSATYQNSTWDVIETDVRSDWESEHPDTWDRFRNAIRHAWEDATGQSHEDTV